MWVKKGRLFDPDQYYNGKFTHASIPTAVKMKSNVFRIFFGSRDQSNRSHVLYADAEIDGENIRIVRVSDEPVLSPGELGHFDEHGVMPGSVIYNEMENLYYMYYIGWQRLQSVPFNLNIGLAFSKDLKRFHKIYKVPVIPISDDAPFLNTSPFVMYDEGIYKMWHVGGVKWVKKEDGVKHFYNIRYAISVDGVHWKKEGVAVDFKYPNEYALARPSVLKENGIYKMWYSFRASSFGETYRIGYAESIDGRKWIRKDELSGIDVSESGWDSEMICYPFVFKHNGVKFMLYNGNGYGRTGFGYAVWRD